jgi:uncharacterized alkaline shock family protein YloU
MTDAVAEAPNPAAAGTGTAPEDRGRLDIHGAVLRKIAEHATDTVAGSARVTRRVAGLGLGEHGAHARVSGPERELRVRLDLALRYPAPVAETVRTIREHVDSELGRLAGCQVRSVDVTVSALVPDQRPPRVE